MSAFVQRLQPLLLIAGLLAACSSTVASPATSSGVPDQSGLPVAPELEAYWESHGGEAVLGPALERPRQAGSRTLQAFANIELVHDPLEGDSARVSAMGLGRRLGLVEPPVPPPASGAAQYFPETGHSLYTGFAQAFDQLGGLSFAGAPIGEAHFTGGLILQCFENIGLYREEDAPPSDVHLLAYGLAAYPDQRSAILSDLEIVLPPGPHTRPFASLLDRLGGEAVLGQPLGDPYAAEDDVMEQVFERAVLFAPQGQPDLARLRPLGLALGPAEPGVPPSSDPDSLYFAATGHNIERAFARFYRTHDGERFLGLPLEEAEVRGELLTQRFENAVLEYHDDLPERLAVQLAPLGRAYAPPTVPVPSPTPAPVEGPAPAPGPGAVEIRTWVERPFLRPGETQRIHVEVLRPDGLPWFGVVPVVQIVTPRAAFFVDVPPTDAEGSTRVDLIVPDLEPGEIVNYEVAVAGEHGLGYAIGQFAGRLSP
jgi:hypothetical protein